MLLLLVYLIPSSWFLQSADIYSRFIVIQLFCNIIYMSCAVFELDLVKFMIDSSNWYISSFKIKSNQFQKVQDIDFDIFLLLIVLSTSGLSLFLFSFFGKMATESYEKMAISLFESDWPKLPVHLQRFVLLMIQNAQIPLQYHGFHVISLNLETYSKVSTFPEWLWDITFSSY